MSREAQVTIPYPSFDRTVPPQGYCWWYIDAVSDDQQHMITIIAFVGSVFSPYYKRAKRKPDVDPANHCSINVVLYGKKNRWCMTERYKADVHRDTDHFVIGPSSLTFSRTDKNSGVLSIVINEKTVPLPRSVRGRIEVDISLQYNAQFALDKQAKHTWWPAAPNSRIRVNLDSPKIQWQGHAYADMNWGSSPIEDDIDYWCWSRYRTASATRIYYDVYQPGSRPGKEPDNSLAIMVPDDGQQVAETEQVQRILKPPLHRLSRTKWFMSRHARSESVKPKVTKTLEDTPFYSRSAVRSCLDNTEVTGIHESVSLTKFKHPVVQAMLHFRMPKFRWRGETSKPTVKPEKELPESKP